MRTCVVLTDLLANETALYKKMGNRVSKGKEAFQQLFYQTT